MTQITTRSDQTITTSNVHAEIQALLHDLKNPLSLIHSSMLMMQDKTMFEPEDIEQFQQRVLTAVEEMSRLIDDYLTLSKIEDNPKLDLTREPLLRCIYNVVDSAYPAANMRNISLTFDPLSQDHDVDFDYSRIMRLFRNLINNAIKYTPSGGHVHVTGCIEYEEVVISVSDTGIGIPESDLPHIFERFYRAGNVKQHEINGTGLGLFICRTIIKQHNGRIAVRSNHDNGTCFTIWLPRYQ